MASRSGVLSSTIVGPMVLMILMVLAWSTLAVTVALAEETATQVAVVEPDGGAAADRLPRFAFTLDGGVTATSIDWSSTTSQPQFGETKRSTSQYTRGSGLALGGSVAVRLYRHLGIEAALGYSEGDVALDYEIRSPHPFYFGADRQAAGSAQKSVQQTTYNVDLTIGTVLGRVDMELGVGPSFVQVDAPLLKDVTYSDVYPFDTLDSVNPVVITKQGDGVGLNVAGRAVWRLNDVLGFGAELRYTLADVELTAEGVEPVSIDVGGFTAKALLRLQF
jgi:hypothetical protein